MIEYIHSEMKVVKPAEKLDIAIPDIKTTVKFNVYQIPSTYVVEINKDGSWSAVRTR